MSIDFIIFYKNYHQSSKVRTDAETKEKTR